MNPAQQPPQNAVRIYREDADPEFFTPDEFMLAMLDPHEVATHELLRPLGPRPHHRELEPFSRNWFEEIEQKRFAQPTEWLRRCLEFTRHKDESLLMFGPGAGSDAVQYQRHGTQVTVALTESDCPALLRQHFSRRGIALSMVDVYLGQALPFESNRFDLAYLNLVATPHPDVAQSAAEIYRVLKPGGKLFLLAPAFYDVAAFMTLLAPWRWFRKRSTTPAKTYTAKQLKRLTPQYTDVTVQKRHLRRNELPYLLRSLPLGIMQRICGHILVYKAFKPISEAFHHDETIMDAA